MAKFICTNCSHVLLSLDYEDVLQCPMCYSSVNKSKETGNTTEESTFIENN